MDTSLIEYTLDIVSYRSAMDREKKENGVALEVKVWNLKEKIRLPKKSVLFPFNELVSLKKLYLYGDDYRREFRGFPIYHGRQYIDLSSGSAAMALLESDYRYNQVEVLKSIRNFNVACYYNPISHVYEVDQKVLKSRHEFDDRAMEVADGMPPEKDQPLTILQIVELLRDLEDKNPKFKVRSLRKISSLRCRTNGVSVLLDDYKERIHRTINHFAMTIGEPVTNWKGGHRFVNWECLVAVGGVNGFNNRYITGINWRGGWKTTSVKEWEKKEALKWI